MTPGRGAGRGVRGLALSGLLIVCGALAGAPSQAFEPPQGSKNFTPPSSVPNYVSNEAGPFGRGSSAAQPGADRFNTAPVAATGSPAARSEPTRSTAASAGRATHQGSLARGGTDRLKSASTRAARAHTRKARSRAALVRHRSHAASRRPVAAQRRPSAGRSRYAAHGARQAGRSFR
jgi:hypothetical protein